MMKNKKKKYFAIKLLAISYYLPIYLSMDIFCF